MRQYNETMRKKADMIKQTYNAKVVGTGKYRVEIKSGLCNAWIVTRWIFENLEDAKSYCNKETKDFPARVCEYNMVEEENTLYTTTIYTKEV